MKLDGRRESSNVEDRRGMSGGAKAGLGIGGIIVVALMAWMTGGNPLEAVVQTVSENGGLGSLTGTNTEVNEGQREFTEEEQQLAKFSTQILAGTEDVWSEIFKQNGAQYKNPTMVLYTDGTQTACGHVEYLTGTLDKVHAQMAKLSQKEANKLSVRLELLADFYAGVWAHHDNKRFGSLEDGDIEEAINCAQKIGDDYLQTKARGYAVPESFNHGTSKQRMKWFKLGLETGDISKGTTFQCSDAEL